MFLQFRLTNTCLTFWICSWHWIGTRVSCYLVCLSYIQKITVKQCKDDDSFVVKITGEMRTVVSELSFAVWLIFLDQQCVMIISANPPVKNCLMDMPTCNMCRHAGTLSLLNTSTHLFIIRLLTLSVLIWVVLSSVMRPYVVYVMKTLGWDLYFS